MVGDNSDGDVLLTGIRPRTSLYKLQMKAVITQEKHSCAYKISNTASEENTSTRMKEESNNQGEQRFNTNHIIIQ